MSASTIEHVLRENYIIAKIRGQKGSLLERQQLYSLVEFRTQSEIVGVLADGPYGKELSRLREDSSPIDTERAIRLGFARTVNNLIASSQESERKFLGEFIRRFDAYDLAALVIFKAQGKSWEEFIATRQPLAILNEAELHRLYSIDDLHALAQTVGDKALESRLEGFSMTDLDGEKASLVRDVIIGWGEERFYNYLREGLSGADKANCIPIAGSAVDISNLTIILRSKLMEAVSVREHLIPSLWKLDQRSVEQLLGSQDATQALDFMASHHYYRRIFAGARQKYEESKSLSFIETALRRHQVALSRRLFLGFPYSLGIVLAFLILKENEAKNIAAVITGVDAGLPTSELRSLLAVPE